jgi:ubiquinone/menaquinone biosynthesis C-methylase UbiE
MNLSQTKTPAEMYAHYFVPAMFRPWADILLRHADLQFRERILDVACGTGIVARLAAPLAGSEGHVAALDFNPAMLNVAQSVPAPSGEKIEWREGSAMALPFADRNFDVVLCQHGLQFFPDKVGALREMYRVLTPTGRALIIVLESLQKHPVFDALMTSVARHLSLPIGAVTLPFSLSDDDKLREMARDAGFEEVNIIPATSVMTFPEAFQFVPLAVMSSAAALPAFMQLQGPEKAALLDTVRQEVEPIVKAHQSGDTVSFPMYAHIISAKL